MSKYDELEKWQKVQYRMQEEGIEYCFRHYSSFEEIEDSYFHMERTLMLQHMKNLEDHVNDMIDELETQISEEDEYQ